jgi:hypothetical protein
MDFPEFAGGCGIDWQIAMELVHKSKARMVRRIASPSTSDKGYYREDYQPWRRFAQAFLPCRFQHRPGDALCAMRTGRVAFTIMKIQSLRAYSSIG